MYDVIIISTIWYKQDGRLLPEFKALLWDSYFEIGAALEASQDLKLRYNINPVCIER